MNQHPVASFWRRGCAVAYDLLLILAVLVCATYLLLPFTHGEAIPSANRWYQIYLFIIFFSFFVGFWYWRGQTLGMLAWGIKLYSTDNKPLTFWQVTFRFIIAIGTLGIGFLWMITNKNRRSLYDIFSNTIVLTHKSAHFL